MDGDYNTHEGIVDDTDKNTQLGHIANGQFMGKITAASGGAMKDTVGNEAGSSAHREMGKKTVDELTRDVANTRKRLLQTEYDLDKEDGKVNVPRADLSSRSFHHLNANNDRVDIENVETTTFAPIELRIQQEAVVADGSDSGHTGKEGKKSGRRKNKRKHRNKDLLVVNAPLDNTLVDLDVLLRRPSGTIDTPPRRPSGTIDTPPHSNAHPRSIRDISSQKHHIPATANQRANVGGFQQTRDEPGQVGFQQRRDEPGKDSTRTEQVAANVQEFNIDPMKNDEDWEAQEDMSMEHLIWAGAETELVVGQDVRVTTIGRPTTTARPTAAPGELKRYVPHRNSQTAANRAKLAKQANIRQSLQMRKTYFYNYKNNLKTSNVRKS